MEIVFKIIISTISLVMIILIVFFNIRTWKKQIDVTETIKNFFKISYESDLVTRDQNSIYQNNDVVGKIRGEVKQDDNIITMYDIVNAEKMNLKEIFEYKKFKLKLKERGPMTLSDTENGINLGKTFEWLSCEILNK